MACLKITIFTKSSPWPDVPLAEIDALSLNYWMTKFVQEVARPSKERYLPKTLYQIVCYFFNVVVVLVYEYVN